MPRRFVSLLVASCFAVLAVTGVLAFVRPFSIRVVGVHALMGFVFIAIIGFHVANNFGPLKKYFRSKIAWATLAITAALASLFLWQPAPVKAILGLSGNLGPALERFEMREDRLVFHYSPAPTYKMALTARTGEAFDLENPPHVAIWLENQSFYHIKTLRGPDGDDRAAELPYWAFKVRRWEEAKAAAKEAGIEVGEEVDGVSGATQNSSFDPADYILLADPENPMPYRLLIEINQPGDAHGELEDQPSIVYQVEIDNSDPRAFQVLEIVGYPKREEDGDGEEAWSLYYVDERFGSALELIDSPS